MPSEPLSYGSIASSDPPVDREQQPLVSNDDHHASEVPVGRFSPRSILSVLAVVATTVAFVFASGNFEGDQVKSAKWGYYKYSKRYRRSPHVLLSKNYDDTEMYYDNQLIDHMDPDDDREFSHRYYKVSRYWKGPGHPIFVIMGGEDPLELPMLYPYVNKGLAKAFGAFVISPEHRFYGKSQPVRDATVKELNKYLTVDQALLDAISLVQYTRESIGCSMDKSSKYYCPVISVGASYPGFLAALLRIVYPEVVDMAYAASAPLPLYAQTNNPEAYFDKITQVAENAVPGCAVNVNKTLHDAKDELLTYYTSVEEAAELTGFCFRHFPRYIKTIEDFVSEIITYLVPAVFADFNMAYYPPGPDSALERACRIFNDHTHSPLKKVKLFYDLRGEVEYGLESTPKCFDVSLELPSGPNATLRSTDSSGSGGGFTGEIWEFQCCKDLVPRVGYSEASMFVERVYSLDWLKGHCASRFEGIQVDPFRMVKKWQFDDMSKTSRILFINGLKDGWSTASILESNNPDIAIINLPNGAHHSDLTQMYPDEDDTDDIIQGHEQAEVILRQWLDQIKDEAKRTTDDDYEITTDDDHKITTDDDHKITFDDDHKITFDDDR